jgi:hypothetical protein
VKEYFRIEGEGLLISIVFIWIRLLTRMSCKYLGAFT